MKLSNSQCKLATSMESKQIVLIMLERKSKIPEKWSGAVTVVQGLWAAARPGRKSLSTAAWKEGISGFSGNKEHGG